MPEPAIIVIGGSAGSIEAISRIAADLPSDLNAAIGIVVHVPFHARSALPDIVSRSGPLKAAHAQDGAPAEAGTIAIAPPNHHLWIEETRWRLSLGPRENGHRPAIDPLFRTAARSHGRRVIGVILSGNLDDGTAGLAAIKRGAGVAVVQDPKDASYGEMPQNAIDRVPVDHVLPAERIGPKLVALVEELQHVADRGVHTMADEMDEEEKAAVNGDKKTREHGAHPGEPTVFTCPECGGTIWELMEGETLRFRCHVGHAYSPESFLAEQADALESALWTAYRALQDKASLSTRMAERARKRDNALILARFEEDARAAREQAALVLKVILNNGFAGVSPDRAAEKPAGAGEPQAPGRPAGGRGRSSAKDRR